MAVVNGIENPPFCIPANGVPITFHLNDGISHPVVPSEDDRCAGGWTAPINWNAHPTATEMWAANVAGESAHIPIVVEVPEVGLLPGLALLLVVAWTLSRGARSS